MTDDRVVAAQQGEDEDALETSLRPRTLAEYIGQEKVKDNLSIAISAAKQRQEPLDHILLYGEAGMGKATLANIIAAEMGVSIHATSGPAIKRPSDLATILTNLQPEDVLFIDEMHRLPRTVEEILYPAMEDWALDLVLGKGPGARSVRLALPRFTLIGATTRYAMMSPPLRTRFGIVWQLDLYSIQDLTEFVARWARILGVKASDGGRDEIAQRSRGTPREAKRLLRQVRDFAQVMAGGDITTQVARDALMEQGTPARVKRRESISDEVRAFVWNRDGGKCVNCDSQERLEFDHIIAVAKGGSSTARNLQLLCESCNRSKSDAIA
jgi:holliday junction DNA helicase RuvB